MTISFTVDRAQAIERYVAVQERLPQARFPTQSIHIDNLEALTSDIDVFVLDGFGVLNVGDQPIPNAVDRIARLQKAGCAVWVLTNGASLPAERTAQKYTSWGFNIPSQQVVSSRDALMRGMSRHAGDCRWGVAAHENAQIELLAPNITMLEDDAQAFQDCDAFIFLSSLNWSDHRQHLLKTALQERPRPLLVGNPDLVAPHEARISIEPGFFTHQLQDETGVVPEFYGKPFADAFDIVNERLTGVAPDRIAMVGDTLHTDILGGAAAGWKTVLITDFGLLKGADVNAAIAQSGIQPDYISPVT